MSVPLRVRARSAVRSVAEERTAEARVRRARAAPSMGCKELPTHTKQPSSVALCGRLRSGERPGRARGGGAKRDRRARNHELDFVRHNRKAQRPSGELRGHTSGAVGSRGHANLSASLGSKRPLELNRCGVRAKRTRGCPGHHVRGARRRGHRPIRLQAAGLAGLARTRRDRDARHGARAAALRASTARHGARQRRGRWRRRRRHKVGGRRGRIEPEEPSERFELRLACGLEVSLLIPIGTRALKRRFEGRTSAR